MGKRSKRVDQYIDNVAEFAQPILREIREIFHESFADIEEDIKWNIPAFMHKGIVSNLAAFKNHVCYTPIELTTSSNLAQIRGRGLCLL